MPRKSISHETQHAFDLYANAYTMIEEPHRMSHDGFMFHASGKVLAIADAADLELLLAVPAGTYPHIQRLGLSLEAGDVDILVYEAPTVSVDGTLVPSQNTNRNSANTASMVITHTPTTSADGDLIHTNWVPPTGAGVGSSEGILNIKANGEEWILAADTKYLIRITNESGGVIDLRYEIVFYEIGADAEA